MSTCIAFANSADNVVFGFAFLYGGPLPRILSTIGEENVRSGGILATLTVCSLGEFRKISHIHQVTKDIRAVLAEVVLVNHWTAHRVNVAHSLEPAELGAVLERPLTTTRVSVDDCAGNTDSIILIRAKIFCISVRDDSVGNISLTHLVGWRQRVTKCRALTVLNGTGYNIGIIGEVVI